MTFLNVLVVALVFLAYTCVLETSGVLWFILPKYLETVPYRDFYELTCDCQGFTPVSSPCRSWLLYACLALFVGIECGISLSVICWNLFMKVSMKKNWRQNRMKQFGFTLFYGFIVWLWSWSFAQFAIMLSYADWDSREKEAQRVAERVTTRTVSEVEYYHRGSQPNLLSLWLKIRPASKGNLQSISVSAHQTTSIGN